MSSPAKLRRLNRWKLLASRLKTKTPCCANPFGLHGAKPAEDIHHILPLKDFPELAFTLDNLVGLCRLCHGKIEHLERKGVPTFWIFLGDTPEGGSKSLKLFKHRTDRLVKKFSRESSGRNYFDGGSPLQGGACLRVRALDNQVFCNRQLKPKSTYCGSCPKNEQKMNQSG